MEQDFIQAQTYFLRIPRDLGHCLHLSLFNIPLSQTIGEVVNYYACKGVAVDAFGPHVFDIIYIGSKPMSLRSPSLNISVLVPMLCFFLMCMMLAASDPNLLTQNRH